MATRARIVKHGKVYDIYKGERWMGFRVSKSEAEKFANDLNSGQRPGGVRGL